MLVIKYVSYKECWLCDNVRDINEIMCIILITTYVKDMQKNNV